MSYGAKSGTFTYTLTDGSITITSDDGISALAVVCTTATTGTIIGDMKFQNLSPSAIVLEENVPYSSVAAGLRVLSGLTITAPSGCSIDITMTN